MTDRSRALELANARFMDRANGSAAALLRALTVSPLRSAIALMLLVFALHLAGNLLLPPLDRTEVIYAQTARQTLESGVWTDPRFQSEAKFEKPLPVVWLQGASAWATGQADQIRGYRIPSILGTLLAVLFTFFGARPLIGARVALVGAGLLATMLVVTVQATLAMPEALMLAATCAAMWALARAYLAREGELGWGVALAFWTALGVGMLVNVLTVPLIALLAALALVATDRGRAGWLLRLRPLAGLPLMLAIASLWPLALWHAGTLDSAVAQWREEGMHLLLGPQEMKWRVAPGLFVLFLLLGLFPAGLFLGPALVTAWRERATPVVRFLFAWVFPYLLILELFTRKTPLYMVQAMMPPLAVLFAMWVVREGRDHEKRWYRIGTYGWLLLVIGLVAALWALPFLLKLTISPLAVVLGIAVVALALVTTSAMLEGARATAAISLVAMAVAFNNLAIPVTFAGLRPVWVSSEIRAAVDVLKACKPGAISLSGFREPSSVFELGTRALTGDDAAYSVWSATEFEAWRRLTEGARIAAPGAVACVAAYDFIHVCSHRFTIFARGEPREFSRCALPDRFRCESVAKLPKIGRACK